MNDISVLSGLFNGFGVFATLKVSQQQALWNWSIDNISFTWLKNGTQTYCLVKNTICSYLPYFKNISLTA
jgi:hypothetical protein